MADQQLCLLWQYPCGLKCDKIASDMVIKETLRIPVIAFLISCLIGCTGIGPNTISRDRFNYTKAISDSWKSQLMLNMVMIRYGDAPVFLDITSIINSYSVETQMEGNLLWINPGAGSEHGIGGLAKYTDRPTITYNPLSGQKFARSLMTPVSITALLHFMKSGQPIELVFRLYIHSINSVRNRDAGSLRSRAADPEFYALIEKLHRIREAGAVGIKVVKEDRTLIPMIIFQKTADEEVMADIAAVYRILGLNPDVREFPLVFRTVPENDREIAILTRSLLEVIDDLASYIQVPQVHVEENRVSPTLLDKTGVGMDVDPAIRIYSSPEKPSDAFVAVHYDGYWFWINNRDLRSKIIFSYIMFIFTLTETEGASGAPIVTIPAN